MKYSIMQSAKKKQPYAIEMERKRQHMVTKSRLRARNGDGVEGEISIYSTDLNRAVC